MICKNYFNQTVLTILFLSLSTLCSAEEIAVNIIQVHDGDTITAIVDQKPIKIRLMHIDAPEKAQARGLDATYALKKLCINQIATANIDSQDRYGRSLAVITIAGKNINQEMVRQGWAWWYSKYSTDTTYKALQAAAKKNKLGLWADTETIPPWEFRRDGK